MRHQGHIQANAAAFPTCHGQYSRKPSAIKCLGVAVECATHHANIEVPDSQRLVVSAQIALICIVTVDELASGDTPLVIKFIFDPQAGVGIAKPFFRVKVGRVKPRIEPSFAEDDLSVNCAEKAHENQRGEVKPRAF